MHQYTIHASVQVIPLSQDRHPYEWVDEAIGVIQRSGIVYQVGAFGTILEGSYAEVMALIQEINEYLYQKGCPEWINQLQIQIRSGGPTTAEEKTAKYAPF
jgi:uncharacterized protein (TIGR00106 family)